MGNVLLTGKRFSDRTIVEEVRVASDGVLIIIPYETEQTHQGRFFTSSAYSASIANNASFDLLIVTTSISPHFGVNINSSGQGLVLLYEDATTSNNGTEITCVNANRLSTKVSTCTCFHTPTVTTTGTLLITSFSPGGSGSKSVGATSGDFARVTEVLAKLNSKYLVRFTNTSGSAQAVSIQFGWFEGI